jgi:hypothetical protein
MALIKYDEEAQNEQLSQQVDGINGVLAKLNKFTITVETEKQVAGRWLVETKERLREFEESDLYVSHKDMAAAIRRQAKAFKKIKDKYEEVVRLLNSKIVDYDRKQKRIALEEEARIRREQEEEAEREREAIKAEAEEAEQRGDPELARQLEVKAEQAATPIPFVGPPSTPTKIEGTQRRTTWKARVVDLDKVPMDYCKKVPDMAQLNSHARKYEGKNPIPGIEFFEDVYYAKG